MHVQRPLHSLWCGLVKYILELLLYVGYGWRTLVRSYDGEERMCCQLLFSRLVRSVTLTGDNFSDCRRCVMS